MLNFSDPATVCATIALVIIVGGIAFIFFPSWFKPLSFKWVLYLFFAFTMLTLGGNAILSHYIGQHSDDVDREKYRTATIDKVDHILDTTFSTKMSPLEIRKTAANCLGLIGKIETVEKELLNEPDFWEIVARYDPGYKKDTLEKQDETEKRTDELVSQLEKTLQDTIGARVEHLQQNNNQQVNAINEVVAKLRHYRGYLLSEQLTVEEKYNVRKQKTILGIDKMIKNLLFSESPLLTDRRDDDPQLIFHLNDELKVLYHEMINNGVDANNAKILALKNFNEKLNNYERVYVQGNGVAIGSMEYVPMIDTLLKYSGKASLPTFKHALECPYYDTNTRSKAVWAIANFPDVLNLRYLCEHYAVEHDYAVKSVMLVAITNIRNILANQKKQ